MRIIADPGGAVTDYVERFEAARVSGAGMILHQLHLSRTNRALPDANII
jgi:hypothetical protein